MATDKTNINILEAAWETKEDGLTGAKQLTLPDPHEQLIADIAQQPQPKRRERLIQLAAQARVEEWNSDLIQFIDDKLDKEK